MKGSTGLKSPPSNLGSEGKGGESKAGRVGGDNGVEMGFVLFSRKGYGKRRKLRKPRKTQRGQFKTRRKTNANIKNRKKKKIRTHIVIREQLKSLLVFPK